MKHPPTARSLQLLVIFDVLTYFFITDDAVFIWRQNEVLCSLLESVFPAECEHVATELEHSSSFDIAGKMEPGIAAFLTASGKNQMFNYYIK